MSNIEKPVERRNVSSLAATRRKLMKNLHYFLLYYFCICIIIGGCSTKKIVLRSEVEGGKVYVDSIYRALDSYTYHFKNAEESHTAYAKKPGHVATVVTFDQNSSDKMLLPCKPRVINIIAEQKDSKIYIDNKYVGKGIVSYTFRDDNKHTVYAEKAGYIAEVRTFSINDIAADIQEIKLSQTKDDAYFASVQTDAANKWLQQEVSKEMDKQTAWNKVVSMVTTYFDAIEVMDPQSGYIRTAWRIGKFPNAGKWIRTQVVVNIETMDPLSFRLKLKSEWSEARKQSTQDEDYQEYNRVLRKYFPIIEAFRGRLRY